MGNIVTSKFKTSKADAGPTPEKVLISPELDKMCTLFVAHKELRAIFAQYFVEADWISVFLEHIPNEVSQGDFRHHISYLLPSGGYLYVTDDRANLYRSKKAMRASFHKQKSLSRSLSSHSLSPTATTASHFTFSHHHTSSSSHLILQPTLLVLAAAVRTFAHSPEMIAWQHRHERQEQLKRLEIDIKPSPRISMLQASARLLPKMLSFRSTTSSSATTTTSSSSDGIPKTSSSTPVSGNSQQQVKKHRNTNAVVPFDGDETEDLDAPCVSPHVNKNKKWEDDDEANAPVCSPAIYTTKQLASQLSSSSLQVHSQAQAPRDLPRILRAPAVPPGSPCLPHSLSRATSRSNFGSEVNSPANSVQNHNHSHSPQAVMTTCTHENLRLVLLDGIHSLCPPRLPPHLHSTQGPLSFLPHMLSFNLSLAPHTLAKQLSRGLSSLSIASSGKHDPPPMIQRSNTPPKTALNRNNSKPALQVSSSKTHIGSFSRSNSNVHENTADIDATEDVVEKLLSSKKWLIDLVRYITEELPFALTIAEPPVSPTIDDDPDAVHLFSSLQHQDSCFTLNTHDHAQQVVFTSGSSQRSSYFHQEGASSFPYIYANRAFATLLRCSSTDILGKTINFFTDECCTEMNQLHRLQEAQYDGQPVKLAMTVMQAPVNSLLSSPSQDDESYLDKRKKIYDLIATKPVISLQGEYIASLSIHYPLAGNEEKFPEDLQAADVLTHLVSTLMV